MELFIFKTNIPEKKVQFLEVVFNNYPLITDWSIDVEDVDNVLRIEAMKHAKEKDIILLINAFGFQCEELPD